MIWYHSEGQLVAGPKKKDSKYFLQKLILILIYWVLPYIFIFNLATYNHVESAPFAL